MRTATTWTQQGGKLTGSGEIGEGEFGNSVALSAEGKDALLGGPGDRGEHVGAAWVFTRTGTTWTQQGEKLTAKSGEEIGEGEVGGKGQFAYSVALSPDGNTALIGAPNDNDGVGAAWIFTRDERKMDPAGREAHRQKRGRDRRGRIRQERGALQGNRRHHVRADRRPRRQRSHRRGVGLHAHERKMDPAGRETHRQRRRDRQRRIRRQRGAAPKKSKAKPTR